MERWSGKIAVVTGASSGIGAACVCAMVNHGMIVIGLTRRIELIAELRTNVIHPQHLHALKCNVRVEEEVIASFAEIEKSFGPIAVLVNNAGTARGTSLLAENNGEDLRAVLETNVLGVAYCTREAFRSMKRHQVEGHVMLVNSVGGHKVFVYGDKTLDIYAPSKHAVTAMTETYRQEFRLSNAKVKITSISPGVVDTEIFGDRSILETIAHLQGKDIADAVIYCLQTPPHVQIHELTIKPIGDVN